MLTRFAAATLGLFALAAPACAWEVEQGPLPTFARSATAAVVAENGSPWTGFSPTDASLAASGYTFRTSDNLLVGIDTRSAWSLPQRFSGGGLQPFGFNATNVKLGYDLGQIRPFVTAGFGSAPFSAFGRTAFTGGDPLQAPGAFGMGPSFTTVGAGFDIPISNNVTIGFSASMTQLRGPSP